MVKITQNKKKKKKKIQAIYSNRIYFLTFVENKRHSTYNGTIYFPEGNNFFEATIVGTTINQLTASKIDMNDHSGRFLNNVRDY